MSFMEHFSNAKGGRTQPLKGKIIEFCINDNVKCRIIPCTSFEVWIKYKNAYLLPSSKYH